MTVIRAGGDAYTVVVTVDTEPEFMADLERHARLGLEVFRGIDGFISGALHKSHDERSIGPRLPGELLLVIKFELQRSLLRMEEEFSKRLPGPLRA